MDDVLVISCHYNEDLDWLYKQHEFKYIVYSKTNPHVDKNHRYIPRNVGCEAEAYLHFIVDNYECLPTTMIFIHGHERSSHQHGTILDILHDAQQEHALTNYRYLNLNFRWHALIFNKNESIVQSLHLHHPKTESPLDHDYVCENSKHTHINSKYLARVVLGDNFPDFIYHKVCAQFIVHKSLIVSRPLEYWKMLLKLLYDLNDEGICSRAIGVYFEVLWFYIFTTETNEMCYSKTFNDAL